MLRCVVGSHRIGVLQQDGEFIAPHPRDHAVGRGQLLGQPPGNRLQQAITKRVAQHIVHMFEPVQIKRQHCQGLRRCRGAWTGTFTGAGLSVGARDGLDHRFTKTRAVGQARQPVPIGQPADLGVLRPNVHTHVVKRTRQVTDFVGAAGVLQRYVVFAPRQPLRGRQQRAQRRGQALRHEPRAHGKQQHTRHRDDGQQHLQLAVRGHHLIHRAQQQG